MIFTMISRLALPAAAAAADNSVKIREIVDSVESSEENGKWIWKETTSCAGNLSDFQTAESSELARVDTGD